jgi:glycosyltransferase involved in cell wall biosynthesis
VESVLGQTYENLEIIVIDDGSTDNCLDSIADLKDPRIKRLRQDNQGKSVALNRALRVMSGAFYAIHDSDDLSYPHRIERQVAAMQKHPEVAGVFAGHDLIINGRRLAPRFAPKSVEECRKCVADMIMPAHDPTAMFRVSAVSDFEYDPTLRIGQGWDYILRVGEQLPLMVVGECLYSYRINPSSNTRSNAQRTTEKKQMVLQRAFARRNMPFQGVSEPGAAAPSTKDYGVVPHFMESVLDHRRAGRPLRALSIAGTCVLLRPSAISYYKPLAYCFAPFGVIERHRRRRARRQ